MLCVIIYLHIIILFSSWGANLKAKAKLSVRVFGKCFLERNRNHGGGKEAFEEED